MGWTSYVYNASNMRRTTEDWKSGHVDLESLFTDYPSWKNDILFIQGEVGDMCPIHAPMGVDIFINTKSPKEIAIFKDGVYTRRTLDVFKEMEPETKSIPYTNFMKTELSVVKEKYLFLSHKDARWIAHTNWQISRGEKVCAPKKLSSREMRQYLSGSEDDLESDLKDEVPKPQYLSESEDDWENELMEKIKHRKYKFVEFEGEDVPDFNVGKSTKYKLFSMRSWGKSEVIKDFKSIGNFIDYVMSKKKGVARLKELFAYSPIVGIVKNGVFTPLVDRLKNFDASSFPKNGFLVDRNYNDFQVDRLIDDLKIFYIDRSKSVYTKTKVINDSGIEVWTVKSQ